jgi:hypothetical protein
MRASRLVLVLACLTIATRGEAGLTPTKSSQLVTLVGGGACPDAGQVNTTALVTRIATDGSASGLVIPPKQVLVLNDIQVSATNQITGDPFLVGVLVTGAGSTNFVAATHTTAPGSGISVTFAPPTGIAVKSGSTVCVQIVDFSHPAAFVGSLAVAHGFLAPDK